MDNMKDMILEAVEMNGIENVVINLWRKTHTLACGLKATFHLINT